MNWLSDLEEKVGRAGKEIASLREENRAHKSTIQKLRRELADVRGRSDPGGEWESERREIERRVSTLVSRLEGLV